MNALVIRSAKMLATGLERLLAFGILLGVITFAFESIVALLRVDLPISAARHQRGTDSN